MPTKGNPKANPATKPSGATKEDNKAPLKVTVVPREVDADPEATKPENVQNRNQSYAMPNTAVNQEDPPED
jgi:hypothetical protein